MKPEPLKKGDVIAITAPSFGCTRDPYRTRFLAAVEKFREMGFEVMVGDTVSKSDGIGISTDPRVCAEELTRLFLDDNVKAIISAGGGELMCETVGYLDFEKLASAKQKWYLGSSDNTNFMYPLTVAGGAGALYGLNVSEFGREWHDAESQAWGIMTGEIRSVHGYSHFQSPEAEDAARTTIGPCAPYQLDQKKELVYAGSAAGTTSASASGVFLGGCLDVLANLAGTPMDKTLAYLKDCGPVIWILDSCDANPMELRRQIWHLDQCGWFSTASAFIVGRPLAAWQQSLMGLDQYDAVTGILSKYQVPIIMDADIGHIDPVIPFVLGAEGTISADKNNLSFSW